MLKALALAQAKPDEPDISGIPLILDILKSSATTRQAVLDKFPELINLLGKENLTKADAKQLAVGRKEFAVKQEPNVLALTALAKAFGKEGLATQAEFAGSSADLLRGASPADPLSSLFGTVVGTALGDEEGGLAPGAEAPGTFSFTGGPGGTSGAFQGTPEEVLAAVQELLGGGGQAVGSRLGPREFGPTAQPFDFSNILQLEEPGQAVEEEFLGLLGA